jgi:hypothetical protein
MYIPVTRCGVGGGCFDMSGLPHFLENAITNGNDVSSLTPKSVPMFISVTGRADLRTFNAAGRIK